MQLEVGDGARGSECVEGEFLSPRPAAFILYVCVEYSGCVCPKDLREGFPIRFCFK